jgi:hypothetical protein
MVLRISDSGRAQVTVIAAEGFDGNLSEATRRLIALGVVLWGKGIREPAEVFRIQRGEPVYDEPLSVRRVVIATVDPEPVAAAPWDLDKEPDPDPVPFDEGSQEVW